VGDINIGKGTNLNGQNMIVRDVSIEKCCDIAPRTRIRNNNNATFKPSMQGTLNQQIGSELEAVSDGPVDIGNDVWICADAKILSGVTIGDGAVIGADAVVVDDVEPYAVVAGNPAEHKRYRFDPKNRNRLLELQWWDWSTEKMERNRAFFDADLRQTDDLNQLRQE
jgi:virginiamycin A acetyltransferase